MSPSLVTTLPQAPERHAVRMVFYAGWPSAPTSDMVTSVAELADALRELVNDAIPGARTVAAVTVDTEGTVAPPPPPIGLPYDVNPAGLWIDRRTRRVTLAGREIPMTRREFDLLAFLADHPRRVFSREELMRHVWRVDSGPSGRTVDVHIRRLRAKLGREQHRLTTVRGVGYRYETARRPGAARLTSGRN